MSLLKRTAECAEACGTCSFQFLVILSDISDISMLYPYRAFTDPAGHRRPTGSVRLTIRNLAIFCLKLRNAPLQSRPVAGIMRTEKLSFQLLSLTLFSLENNHAI